MSDLSKLRTPDVAAVLDAVRATGQSASAQPHQYISTVVWAVAVNRGVNPKALQDAVEVYADALDRTAGV